jgi:hypothetical protein
MRFMIAGLILALGLPAAEAASRKGQCKKQCDAQYKFCLNRSITKQARKACKPGRRICKSQCRG